MYLPESSTEQGINAAVGGAMPHHAVQRCVHVLPDEGVGLPGLLQQRFDRSVQLLVHGLLHVGEQVAQSADRNPGHS